MLTHPAPSSNSHAAFIFLQLKMFACVCLKWGSMLCFIIWMTCTSFKYYVISVEGIKKDGENRDSEAHDLFQILLISIKLPVNKCWEFCEIRNTYKDCHQPSNHTSQFDLNHYFKLSYTQLAEKNVGVACFCKLYSSVINHRMWQCCAYTQLG